MIDVNSADADCNNRAISVGLLDNAACIRNTRTTSSDSATSLGRDRRACSSFVLADTSNRRCIAELFFSAKADASAYASVETKNQYLVEHAANLLVGHQHNPINQYVEFSH
jgi:hypothetical protein